VGNNKFKIQRYTILFRKSKIYFFFRWMVIFSCWMAKSRVF